MSRYTIETKVECLRGMPLPYVWRATLFDTVAGHALIHFQGEHFRFTECKRECSEAEARLRSYTIGITSSLSEWMPPAQAWDHLA